MDSGITRRHDQSRAKVAEKKEQNRHYQRPAQEQIFAHRADGPVDHHRLVVEGNDLHALGKRTANPFERLFDALDDRLAVLASEHDHHAGDGLALAVARDRPLPRHLPNLDLGDVTQVDRSSFVGRQDDRPQVPLAPDAAQPADGVLLGGMLDEPAAEVVVVFPNPLEHVTERQPVSAQPIGIHLDLVLPRVAAPGVDVGYARHGPQLVFDLPVVERLQLHRAIAFTFERIPIHLAEGRRQRPQRRLEAGRNPAARFVQPFVDELPREIVVHAVSKNNGDQGKTQFGNRADFFGVGKAHHGRLDREGHQLLDLHRRHARRFGDDRDLVVGQVRKRVDGNPVKSVEAGRNEHHQAEQDDPMVIEVVVDEASEHVTDADGLRDPTGAAATLQSFGP